ncbi:MAG: hypothetical protein M1833_003531 [Piccolia ochrophora]|nr:MAG: hypothetical protein M1833_003531 [Piccolia ochrophora]
MPYTPPSQQSPSTSGRHTPSASQPANASQQSEPLSVQTPRANLPRSNSASYINRHRRTPSITKSISFTASPTDISRPEEETDRDEDNADTPELGSARLSGSVHQSPSPVNDSSKPSGAFMSPPDSRQGSSDDEGSPKKRGRELENLAELQAAIRIIEQHRESSPNRARDEARKAKLAFDMVLPPHAAASDHRLRAQATSPEAPPPLSHEARRISHSRSSTVAGPVPPSDKSPSSAEDSEGEDTSPRRPNMLRKKSGELVKPALRPPTARRRPSSMPGTPTYSKAVHFDHHLENVRHFMQVDKPLAVSAGSSPVETYEDSGEFPFGGDPKGSSFDWELALLNFPADTVDRKLLPVRVEKVYLSADNKLLIGSVSVANIAFHKQVVARFTVDYWKTTSEVVAAYSQDVRRKQVNDGYDRFNFNINLADQVDLENKTMFFCVRYTVDGREFWDNNNSMNFQVEFKKKSKSPSGKSGRPLNSLPRSRPGHTTSAGRPLSMPSSFDDFGNGFDNRYDFSQPPSKIIGDSGNSSSSSVRLKNAKPTEGPIPDTPTRRHQPASQAFGNRYDFGASLSAAIQAANSALGDRSGIKMKNEKASDAGGTPKNAPGLQESSLRSVPGTNSDQDGKIPSQSIKQPTAGASSAQPGSFVQEKQPLQSASYNELLDKYCFYGSGKPTQHSATEEKGTSDQVDAPTAEPSVPSKERPAPRVTPPKAMSSPSPDESQSSSRAESPRRARSLSPARMNSSNAGSNIASPVAFGYPYHNGNSGFPFSETHTPTAIRG